MEAIQLKAYREALNKKIAANQKKSSDYLLAEEVWKYFAKQLNFGMIMKLIKNKGKLGVIQAFEEIKKADSNNKIGLFLYKLKQQKILYEDTKSTT